MRVLFRIAICMIACTPAFAQIESVPSPDSTDTGESRKMPNSLEEVRKSEPTPTPAPAPAQAGRTPDEIIQVFFDALKADRVEDAYGTLHSQFALQDRGGEAKKMAEQTQRALDAYGPVVGYELVREEKLGTHLMRRTYLLNGKNLPLRWQFYFYQAEKDWQLIDLRVDDALVEWFDPPKR
jgi:hypothetical protein